MGGKINPLNIGIATSATIVARLLTRISIKFGLRFSDGCALMISLHGLQDITVNTTATVLRKK
jgi:hypothetical protein